MKPREAGTQFGLTCHYPLCRIPIATGCGWEQSFNNLEKNEKIKKKNVYANAQLAILMKFINTLYLNGIFFFLSTLRAKQNQNEKKLPIFGWDVVVLHTTPHLAFTQLLTDNPTSTYLLYLAFIHNIPLTTM